MRPGFLAGTASGIYMYIRIGDLCLYRKYACVYEEMMVWVCGKMGRVSLRVFSGKNVRVKINKKRG